jgi:hypothetical protein
VKSGTISFVKPRKIMLTKSFARAFAHVYIVCPARTCRLRNDDDEITEKRADPPAAAYDGEWESMASVKVGDPLCIKWPAKNHKTHVDSDVKTSSFGERVTSKQVFVYVARTTNEPGDWHDSAQAQRFELEFANCPDPGPSTGDRFRFH